MRVIVDTNVVVSGICFPDSVCGKVLSWVAADQSAVVSPQLTKEMLRVLSQPKLDRYVPRVQRLAAVAKVLESASSLVLGRIEARCRDSADDHVLEPCLPMPITSSPATATYWYLARLGVPEYSR